MSTGQVLEVDSTRIAKIDSVFVISLNKILSIAGRMTLELSDQHFKSNLFLRIDFVLTPLLLNTGNDLY